MLTDIKCTGLGRNALEKNIVKAWTEQGVQGAWDATAWAKKLANKKARANTSDFDRFKVMIAKKEKSKRIAAKM
jgi:large subunit ribosomal protein L14e